MRRILWMILKIGLALFAILVLAVVALLVVLRPPAQLKVPPQGVTLSGLTIINPGAERRANQKILVEGGTIKEIGDSGSSHSDDHYSGSFVLPGLIDLHVHNPGPQGADIAYFFLMYLRYG